MKKESSILMVLFCAFSQKSSKYAAFKKLSARGVRLTNEKRSVIFFNGCNNSVTNDVKN